MFGEGCGKVKKVELYKREVVFSECGKSITVGLWMTLWRATGHAFVGLDLRVVFDLDLHIKLKSNICSPSEINQ